MQPSLCQKAVKGPLFRNPIFLCCYVLMNRKGLLLFSITVMEYRYFNRLQFDCC